MKLAEAFARRTYGGKGVPRDISTLEARKKINDTFILALEKQMVMHMYELWADMRQDDDPDLMSQADRDDFSVYMKNMIEDDPMGYAELLESWMDFRRTDVEKKILQMTKDRFK